MRAPGLIAGVGAGLLALVLMIAGTGPLGRVLIEAGAPGAAVPLMPDAAGRGTALYRAGRHGEAADAFAAAEDPFNEGLAAARAGDYARALAAFDRVLSANPGDRKAKANHALVASLFAGTEFEAVAAPDDKDRSGEALAAKPGQGKARAAGEGDEANNPKTGFWMPDIVGSGLRRVPKMFDAQFIAANGRWLTTLEDQPGVYLRARLTAEQKARIADGTALLETEDPR